MENNKIQLEEANGYLESIENLVFDISKKLDKEYPKPIDNGKILEEIKDKLSERQKINIKLNII